MEYENRQPPEGINITKVHPLKQFFVLVAAAVVLLLILVFLLQFTGAWAAKHIPFSFERDTVARMAVDFSDSRANPGMEAYLNELAAELMQGMPVPDGMTVQVHYHTNNVFNAFATVGGNLMFYRGLMEALPHENALAMVLAHEIAHVLHRDPVAGLGGGVASSVGLLVLTGNAGTGTASKVLTRAGVLSGMRFTRQMEQAADRTALAALNEHYGHVAGGAALFELFRDATGDNPVPDWLERFASTHPLNKDRIADMAEMASANGWATTGELTPLPADYASWLRPMR